MMEDLRIGARIAALLDEKGITLREFADMADMTDVRMNQIVNSNAVMKLDEATRIFKALGITAEEFTWIAPEPVRTDAEKAHSVALRLVRRYAGEWEPEMKIEIVRQLFAENGGAHAGYN